MRKLIFMLSSVNALLNALVIAVFMPPEVIVLYGFSGQALYRGSRWFYLIPVAVPLIISGCLFIYGKNRQKPAIEDDEMINPIDEMLSDSTVHSDNWGLVLTWFFAIISWVFTGIALNNIENIGVIFPSIVVIMLSAVVIFFSGFYKDVAPTAIAGVRLPWLAKNEEVRDKTNRVSFYLGVVGGFGGVCLAAWALVISSIIPNCFAVGILLMLSFVIPMIYSYVIYKRSNK